MVNRAAQRRKMAAKFPSPPSPPSAPTQGSALTSLPDELLDIIVHELPKKDLKGLRETCNHLNNLYKERLFKEIVLLPYKNCLKGFSELFKRYPQVAKHVEHVVYEEFWTELVHLNLQNCETGSDQENQLKKAAKKQLESTYDAATEIEFLSSIFKQLPNLKSVSVGARQWHRRPESDEPPKFFQRIISLYTGRVASLFHISRSNRFVHEVERRPMTNSTLLALQQAGSTLSNFDANDINPCKLMMSSEPASTSLVNLSRLQSLELSIPISKFTNFGVDFGFSTGLVTVLRTATNLDSLTIRCNKAEKVNSHTGDETAMMRTMNESSLQLPSLKTLYLEQLSADTEGLQGFLTHQPCLTSFTVANLSLLSRDSEMQCCIQFLDSLRELTLKNFSVKGFLRNFGQQRLHFSGYTGESFPGFPAETGLWSSIRDQTVSWVTGEVEEMPAILEKVAIKPPAIDLEIPVREKEDRVRDELWHILPAMARNERVEEREEYLRSLVDGGNLDDVSRRMLSGMTSI